MECFSKILVIKLDHIGDLILATPVFKAISEKYPDAKVDALVSKKSKAVIENSPYIETIYSYESRDFDRNHSIDNIILADNIATICKIRQQHYDLVIGLREDLSNIPIQMMCGGAKNISFSTNSRFAEYLDEAIPNDENRHSAKINFDLLSLLDITLPEEISPQIFVGNEDKEWAKTFLENVCGMNRSKLLGFSIGGGWFLNWWPIHNYAKLAELLVKRYKDLSIVLVGGTAETALEEEFRKLTKVPYVSAVGKTSVKQLAALYSYMDLLVTNDGGPMHMATAAGTPVIALFGPSPYNRFGPLGKDNVIISKNFECSPCPQFVQGEKPKCLDNKCMKAITVEEVYNEVVKKLDA